MPRLHPISLAVVCALSIAGCATPAQKQAEKSPGARPVVSQAAGGEGLYRLGRYFEGQGRHERAIAAYREALKRDPLLVDAYTALGTALAARGRYEEAIRQLQAAVVLAPQAAYAQNNLGYAYLLSGGDEQAIKAFEEARRLDPGHAKARENLHLAQARLAASARRAPAESAQAASAPALETTPGLSLVEVAPQVFELRAPARYREIEARPLAPLARKETRSFKLEVSNGNGVDGLAKRVAGWLASAGVRTTRLTNQRPFVQAITEVHYREGYADAAAELVRKLEHPARIVPSSGLARGVDVRLLLGKDVLRQAAERSSRRSRA